MRKMILAFSALLLAGGAALAIEGEPIPNRDVKLGKKPPGKGIVIAHSVTDANGVVSFKNLKDGTYFVRFADADRTFEVASNGSGKPIRVHELSKAPASSEAEGPSEVRKEEKFTISFGTVAARIEVLNDTLKVTLFRPRTPSDS